MWFSRLPTVLAAATKSTGLATSVGLMSKVCVSESPSLSVTVSDTVRGPAALKVCEVVSPEPVPSTSSSKSHS